MNRSHRYVVAALCLLVIIVRALFPEIVFDAISLALLAIGFVALFIPVPASMLTRTKRLKFGSFEIELEELNAATEKLEEKIVAKETKSASISGFKQSSEYYYNPATATRMEIVKLSVEIEGAIRDIHQQAVKSQDKRPIAFNKTSDELLHKGVIDNETHDLIQKFWKIRSLAIHAHDFALNKQELVSFIDIGVRVLKILKTVENNLGNNQGSLYRVD